MLLLFRQDIEIRSASVEANIAPKCRREPSRPCFGYQRAPRQILLREVQADLAVEKGNVQGDNLLHYVQNERVDNDAGMKDERDGKVQEAKDAWDEKMKDRKESGIKYVLVATTLGYTVSVN